MSIYKDLLFLHGYVTDPGILKDPDESLAKRAASKPASATVGSLARSDPRKAARPAFGNAVCASGGCG